MNSYPGINAGAPARPGARAWQFPGIRSITLPVAWGFLACLLLCAFSTSAQAENESYRALVMQSFRSSLPAAMDWQTGIVKGLTSDPAIQMEVDIESPDLSRINDPAYFQNLFEVYRRKYGGYKPQLIIATYTPVLQFLLEFGEQLFPGVPIVFCGAASRYVASLQLPAHITGVTGLHDLAGTLELVLQLHPDSREVVVVAGGGALDKHFGQLARQAARAYPAITFTWLEGMTISEMKDSLRTLPDDVPMLFASHFEDRGGQAMVPYTVVKSLLQSSQRPAYGLWNTLLGSGVVGGRMAPLAKDGFTAGQMGLRILRGAAPRDIPVLDRINNPAMFDGQVLTRLGIPDSRLPEDSLILFREASIWQKHKWEIITASLVILLQGLLIFTLLLNRSRLRRSTRAYQHEHDLRTQSDAVVRNLEHSLTRFGKERSMGAMATTIAHEVNQPLIAIQNYAQAADRRLTNSPDSTTKLGELLHKIQQQASRAGEIVQRIRTLVSSNSVELEEVNAVSIIEEVLLTMELELTGQHCDVSFSPTAGLPAVLADKLEIQLVIVNLLRNAIQAMAAMGHEHHRGIVIALERHAEHWVQITVTDCGPGIDPQELETLFEPFSSRSAEGLGLGLNICKTIIEAHGGIISYTAGPRGGASFRFTLRVAGQ